MDSLDPRIRRLPAVGSPGVIQPKAPLDQLGSFEVFVQPKAGKPFQHEGIVHAPDTELAFVWAKESFTRRFLCVSIFVTDTRHVHVSPVTEGNENAFSRITEAVTTGTAEPWEVFVLPKRGKQHVHVGQVMASDPSSAMWEARKSFGQQMAYNVWVVRRADIRFTQPDEASIWNTLPEKKFRDAADYKGGEKLREFLERTTKP